MADNEDLCDAFLKLIISGSSFVQGECQDKQFANHIALASFEFGSSSDFPDEESREDAQKTLEEHGSLTAPLGSLPVGVVQKAKPKEMSVRQQDGCQFEIEKFLDASSPILFEAYARALDPNPSERLEFPFAYVYLRKSTGGDARGSGLYLTVQFNEVSVVEYGLDVSGGSNKETIKFSYGACRVTYQAQLSTGNLDTAVRPGWSFLSKPPGAI